MYTKYLFKLLSYIFYIPNLIGAQPVHVYSKTGLFYTLSKSRRRLFSSITIFITVVSCFVIRTCEIWWNKGGNRHPYYHVCYALTFVAVIELVCLIQMYWSRNEVCVVLNQMTRYSLRFEHIWMIQGQYNPIALRSKPLPGIVLDICCILLAASCNSLFWTNTAYYCSFPDTSIFHVTLLPIEWQNWYPVYYGHVLFLTYYTTIVYESLLSNAIIALIFAVSGYTILSSGLYFKSGKRYKTYRSLHYGYNLIHEFISLQLIFKQINYIYGIWLLAIHGLFGQFALFCNYSVIKYWDQLNPMTRILLIVWSFVVQIPWTSFLHVAGNFFQLSQRTLKSWKGIKCRNVLERKYFSKARKACRPIIVGADGVFT
ncbi:hypothetical protein Fcan01_24478, partial [Folsomia candida]